MPRLETEGSEQDGGTVGAVPICAVPVIGFWVEKIEPDCLKFI